MAAEDTLSYKVQGGQSTAQHSTIWQRPARAAQHYTQQTRTGRGTIFLHAGQGLGRWEGGVIKKRGGDHSSSSITTHTHTHTEHRQSGEWEEKNREIKTGKRAYLSVGIVDWIEQLAAQRSPRHIPRLETVMQTSDSYKTTDTTKQTILEQTHLINNTLAPIYAFCFHKMRIITVCKLYYHPLNMKIEVSGIQITGIWIQGIGCLSNIKIATVGFTSLL